MRNRTTALFAVISLMLTTLMAAWPATEIADAQTSAVFVDITGNTHETNIRAVADAGITSGCDATHYCPSDPVTRAQMATFLTRALDLPTATNPFTDVTGTHAASVGAVAHAGITLGCDATGTRFCPNDAVTRAQMATFLTRALDLPTATNPFTDVTGTHAASVGAVAEAGITAGCDSSGIRFCPNNPVKRDQMASFLARALDLSPNPGNVVVAPYFIDFADRGVDAGPSSAEYLVLTNAGSSAVTITSVTIGGTNPGDFAITSDTGETTLQPASIRLVGVAFDPISTDPTTRSASLLVETTGGSVGADLSGTALGPTNGNAAPVLTSPGTQSNALNDPVSLQIVGSDSDGDSIVYSASDLPTGLGINGTGLISGTITAAGTWTTTVTGTDGIDEDSIEFTWTVTGEDPPANFDLSMDRFYISQAVPAADSDGTTDVDVVANRSALVRAFVSADAANNAAPTVTLYWQGSAGSGEVVMAGPGEVPTSPSEGVLGDTFTATLDAAVVTNDLEVYVMVDPADSIDETDETNNRYPASGWLDLQAVSVPVLEITFVPITYRGVTPDMSDPAAFLDDALRMLPIAAYNVEVRPTPMVATTDPFDWSAELADLYALRSADGSSRIYHGIVDPDYDSGASGIGYISAPAAISWSRWEADGVVAHELGHNFSLPHAPCGTTGDVNYPYPNAEIGVWGYDVMSGTLKDPSHFVDLMSYCDPEWISDYNYQNIVDFRQLTGAYSVSSPLAADQATLMISGSIDGTDVQINPLFTLDATPTPPLAGDMAAVGYDRAGNELFRVPFTHHEVHLLDADHDHEAHRFDPHHVHGPHHEEGPVGFAFGIALNHSAIDSLHRVEVERAGTPVAVRRASHNGSGMTLVTDAVTGQVTKIIRGDDMSGAAGIRSDGLRSVR